MSIIDHPAPHPATTMALGQPGAEGRWQPTRAGIVNSWAWASEDLLFADGWLTLAGPNGSGKSLTASMLVTVLLDADTSQTALSVSGKAAGTLTSRHTDFNDREDRTGAWWLEYGLRDADTGEVTYLTTGLWLRATGGHLHRAFFLTPGRIGSDLLLQRDREPTRIDDLAGQLAAGGGELFTASPSLRTKALAHLPVVSDERDYRHTIRTRLFAPLDEVQFDALIAVLRSLRSLRTAEAISPTRMRQVLTDALPALDTESLTLIAEAMERIAELETQLQRTREEAKLLQSTDRAYRRYLTTVAQTQAAALTAANTEFDDQTRRTRETTAQVKEAQAAEAAADQEHTATLTRTSQLEGRLEAADSELRGHAGADLPHREIRATELATAADEAALRAEQATTDAAAATEQADSSAILAHTSQNHLRDLADELRTTATTLGAEAAIERLLTATGQLASADTATTIDIDIAPLGATPGAWAEARTSQIRAVDDALRRHQLAQEAEYTAAEELRSTEDEEDTHRRLAAEATAHRQHTEDDLASRLADWSATARQLEPAPVELATGANDEHRVDLGRLTAWLASAAAAARARIDLPRHQQTVATDAALATEAAATATRAHTAHQAAQATAARAMAAHRDVQETARAEAEQAERQRDHTHATYQKAEAAAHADLAEAWQRWTDCVAASARTARNWLQNVHHWRADLVHLSPDAIHVPDTPAVNNPAEDTETWLAALRPAAIELMAQRAHAAAVPLLHHHAEAAEHQANLAAADVDAIEAELVASRQAAATPPAPSWRTRQAGDGTPLWALVDFASHLTDTEASRIEGALLVAGILDALVTPDGRAVAGDLTLTPTRHRAARTTLADVLHVEPDPAIDPDRVRQLLHAIPLDTPGSDLATGQLTSGVLTAAAPDGYRAAYIGRTARERARLERVAALEGDLAAAEQRLAAAGEEVRRRRQDIQAAADERDAFPNAGALLAARDDMVRLRREAATVQGQTDGRIAAAEHRRQQALAEIQTAAVARAARLAAAEQDLRHAEQAATEAGTQAEQAGQILTERQQAAQRSEAAREAASDAQQLADAEQAAFPLAALAAAQAAQGAEDDAGDALTRARSIVLAAAERHRTAGEMVKNALRTLNQRATLPDGSLLPTEPAALDRHARATEQLASQTEAWKHAALRATDLLHRALHDADAAKEWTLRCERARQEADTARLAAHREAAAVAEIRSLHGAEYERLRHHRTQTAETLQAARAQAEKLLKQRNDAAVQAATAQATLEGIAPHRQAAESRRDACLRQLGRLAEENLLTVPDDLPTDASGRPAHLTAGLAWARHLLSDRPASADRLTTLTQTRDRALAALETSARTVNTALARFDRQVTLVSIEDTDWRRAIVADPGAARGEDLHAAVEALNATAGQLEDDLRADIKQTLKTSLFTRLRSDVRLRREAAQELVRKIRSTLSGVRTGVAGVGVQVAWTVREDEDAQRMVDLISQPPSDAVFEQMYAVLRQRMDEKAGEPWAERVAHTFDYRAWHDWEISLTHASFGDGSAEKFRKVTARSNPLEALSTGERRLATMLPLLAAAWSMYSGDSFKGPRLLSVDEIDAAFDEPNLRQVLALLRSWDFDVLATAPFMTPMIKQEARKVMVHQVVTAGRHRVTVPWLWQGHGEPQPLTLDLHLDHTHREEHT
ncbi:SbcC/MukB-like Walker B domain-containing protein [Streptomyces sp. DSM 42041]|uniref:SbcC/MukB-like Walker B domain-containing protein n=1 Tax=Streptomyces hazeniae TaxID=3075538 RepID=A0ABU2P2I8_9ACTN|nr:SbcC/MukB-like Walker B domain-containing protein [Streptomyces sp. DSM 42041]MDT0382128.1 SbcC/MukB-like Walker B domain-containing protein [Streptomyces sp. DSM 42041]